MDQKELIIKLIKDDLINNKLVDGLNEIGLEADYYHLYLSEVILEMIGIKIDNANFDRVYQKYEKLTKGVRKINIRKPNNELYQLAENAYLKLCELRVVLEKENGKK